MKEKWDFWFIVGFMVANLSILIAVIGFILSMNARINDMNTRMATKEDIRELRGLIISHITNGHKSHSHKESDQAQSGQPSKKNREIYQNIHDIIYL